MEVMNVPHSRSRISLTPSMVRGSGAKRKSMKGDGIMGDILKEIGKEVAPIAIDLASNYAKKKVSGGMVFPAKRMGMKGEGIMGDILKEIGKEVAPIAIDLASDYAKKRLGGGMSLPINISPAQKRTLKRGGAITIKPDMVSEVAQQSLAMLPSTAKKILGSLSKNKGIRVSLKQGEDVIDRMTGKGILDVLKQVGKVVAPIAIDVASRQAKRYVEGEGILDVLKQVGKVVAPIAIDVASRQAKRYVEGEGIMGDILKEIGREVAPIAIDLASDYAKKKVSGGSMRRVRMMPYVSKQVMEGGSFMAAGGGAGGGIYPAGRYGSGMPIQLGSPYINMNSPAMNPFVEHRGIQSYDPIGKKR